MHGYFRLFDNLQNQWCTVNLWTQTPKENKSREQLLSCAYCTMLVNVLAQYSCKFSLF